MPFLSKVELRLARLEKILAISGERAVRGRVHPRFATHSQDNARWSTTNPPMATVPADLRNLFCPDPRWPWFGGDADQQELRILAAIANDCPLLETFARGWDVHTLNCCDIFKIPHPPNKKDPHKSVECIEWRKEYGWEGKDDLRRVFAKRFVYRLNYGGDPRTAGDIPGAKALGLTPDRLVAASKAFLAAHPSLASWRHRIESDTLRTKCVRTFLGRRRMLHASGKEIVRAAFDYPMQAGASDMVNLTIIALREAFGDDVRFVYSMHDSITLAVKESIFNETTKVQIADILEREWDVYGRRIRIPWSFFERPTTEPKREWKRPATTAT